MANGVLTLLKAIHSAKPSELERNYHNRCEEIEKRLAKENPKYQELTSKTEAKEQQIQKLNEEVNKIGRARMKLFTRGWDAKEKAAEILREDYLKLRVKTTLNGIPKERIKKMVEDFHNKDYLAIAMGA